MSQTFVINVWIMEGIVGELGILKREGATQDLFGMEPKKKVALIAMVPTSKYTS